MTLLLERGTKPTSLGIKTFGWSIDSDHSVYIGGYEISLEDFLFAAHYVLTNTDLLEPGDPRLQFIKCVQSMKEVAGFSPGRKRLKASENPKVIQKKES